MLFRSIAGAGQESEGTLCQRRWGLAPSPSPGSGFFASSVSVSVRGALRTGVAGAGQESEGTLCQRR